MASSMVSNNNQISKKKRGRNDNSSSLTANQSRKRATKFCLQLRRAQQIVQQGRAQCHHQQDHQGGLKEEMPKHPWSPKEANTIDEFDALSISSSDSDDISYT
eukprot:6645069-Ditylum_brightwellii.AAC.1